MGQIIGIDTSLIKNISGINASEITKIGEIDTEYTDRKGNPVKLFTGAGIRSISLPYTFTPGGRAPSAETEKSSDVEEPSNSKILGAARIDDSNNSTPTFKINNFKNKLYKLPKTEETQIFTISQWFRINDFPRHTNNVGYSIRKKATVISKYDFKTPESLDKLSGGYIEFGAIGPYYRKFDNSKPYKGAFVPFSLGVFINNGKYPVSLYTDYAYQLNTWYMISLKIEGNLTNSRALKQPLAITLYINGEMVPTAVYNGRLWSQKQRSKGGRTNRKQVIATSPGFSNFYNNQVFSDVTHNIAFKKFLNLFEMNYVSFSPTTSFGNVGNNNGTFLPGGNGKYPFTNSRIDFGILNISQNDSFPSLYSSALELYPNATAPTSGIFIISNNDRLPENACFAPLLEQVTAYFNSENNIYYVDQDRNEFFNGNEWIYKDLDNNWIVQIGYGSCKIITSC